MLASNSKAALAQGRLSDAFHTSLLDFYREKRRRKVDKLGFRSQGLEVLWSLSACLYIVENQTAEFLSKGKQKLTKNASLHRVPFNSMGVISR